MERQNIPSNGPFEARFGYSRAVRVGNQIHVAGTCAQPPYDTGDAYEQATGALGIIKGALEAAGARMSDVVRTVVYITDTAHAEGVTQAHGETFGGIMPASTMVVVVALLKPHLYVEIEAYAIIA
jgi:enamine deaminase RidA (YjgF/YER057c/UK114 family)